MKELYIEVSLKDGRTGIVRTPLETDAAALIQVMDQVDRKTPFLAREPGEFDYTVEMETEFLRKKRQDEKGFFVVAELDGEVVGTYSCDGMGKRFYPILLQQ